METGEESTSRSSGSSGEQKETVSRTPAASITAWVWVGVTRRSTVCMAGYALWPRKRKRRPSMTRWPVRGFFCPVQWMASAAVNVSPGIQMEK